MIADIVSRHYSAVPNCIGRAYGMVVVRPSSVCRRLSRMYPG